LPANFRYLPPAKKTESRNSGRLDKSVVTDNAFAESFIKTLKAKKVYCNEYETLDQARAGIGSFLEFVYLEFVYNAKRLHSALAYRPPEEFEAAFAAGQAAAASLAAARVSSSEAETETVVETAAGGGPPRT
jgi:hypothetical protein